MPRALSCALALALSRSGQRVGPPGRALAFHPRSTSRLVSSAPHHARLAPALLPPAFSRPPGRHACADKRDDIYKDQEALEKAIADREGGQGKRCSTDIICKHFIDAVERRQYGWIWICPNGGDKCQYRHALPPGYKLKSELDAEKLLAQDAGPSLEDEIEEQRAQLKVRTQTRRRAHTATDAHGGWRGGGRAERARGSREIGAPFTCVSVC